jgi:hypothetical protein
MLRIFALTYASIACPADTCVLLAVLVSTALVILVIFGRRNSASQPTLTDSTAVLCEFDGRNNLAFVTAK